MLTNSVMFPCTCSDPSTMRIGFGICSFWTLSPNLCVSFGVKKLSVAPLSMSAFLTFRTPEMNIGICIALGNVTQVVHTHSPLAKVIRSGAVKNPPRYLQTQAHDCPQPCWFCLCLYWRSFPTILLVVLWSWL